ncbi:hypothetical protein BpHYR1_019856 [Brachionus plicatilis]|uniref:Uncharacterized protein n=1 Tax=Brachionus plicatilis TaxID=10195 RepID=A0A3M7R3K0_BRAPC|nr:hypothetical protein BpHYR1_019856 [Brachionus plicatilis]
MLELTRERCEPDWDLLSDGLARLALADLSSCCGDFGLGVRFVNGLGGVGGGGGGRRGRGRRLRRGVQRVLPHARQLRLPLVPRRLGRRHHGRQQTRVLLSARVQQRVH